VTDLSASSAAALDAVVVTWNRWELTSSCLEHLFASSVPIHVIVIDNGSEDGTPDRIREQFPQVELHENAENKGYGAAANAGIAHSTNEFVSTVNSDALVAEDYFELLLAAIKTDPKLGFVSGISLDPATGLVDAAGAIFDGGLRWSPYLQGVDPDEVVADQSVIAAPPPEAMLYRREAFQGVGGYDEEIFAYGEDLELTLRLRAAGWKPLLVTEARDLHKGAASLGKRTAAQMRLVGWGRGYVAGRYRLGIASLILDLATYVAISIIVKSPSPFTQLIDGYLRGRKLPKRPVPEGLHTESWATSLRKRWDASRT
jgi:GT2 family glycosyltransferase